MIIQEAFYSYQGEGPFVGYPQIFIRFFGCNIACNYCDEPDLKKEILDPDAVMKKIDLWLKKPLHSISFTGGEPLLQVDAIQKLMDRLDPHDVPYFLETNGMFPDQLKKVADRITYFSVDYKPGHAQKFAEFLAICHAKGNAYAKFIVLADSAVDDVVAMTKAVLAIDPKIPVILQPVTPYGVVTERPSFEQLDAVYTAAHQLGADVRIIGQTHKLIGVL